MIVVNKPKYKISIDEEACEIVAQLNGFFKQQVVLEYFEDLDDTADKVVVEDYKLIIDATMQAALASDVVSVLSSALLYYQTFGFKEVVVVMPISKISSAQVAEALKDVDFKGTVVSPTIQKND